MGEAKAHYIFDKVTYCKDAYDALVDVDALLLVTEWSEFRIPSWDVVSKQLKNKVVFDGRNIYDRKYLESLGFRHYGIGLKNMKDPMEASLAAGNISSFLISTCRNFSRRILK